MATFPQASGKYSVFVTGGNANVGHKARMNFYRGGQRRGYTTGLSTRTTTRISGPGQLLRDIPPSVLSEVVMYLNNPSPLRNNWKGIAAELSLSFPTVQSLDHHGEAGMMEGVLEIMFQKKMTVQDFADILEKIERPDIIEVLVKAGLPERNSQKGDFNDDGEKGGLNSSNDLQDVTIVTPDVTCHSTSTDCKQTCSLKHYNLLVKDLPKEQNVCKESNVTNGAWVHEVPSSVDKLPDIQGHHDKTVICKESVSQAQHEELKYSVISIEGPAGESNEVVVIKNSTGFGGSFFERMARFIFNVYSGICGRLVFREN